jgi:hypothetical protein
MTANGTEPADLSEHVLSRPRKLIFCGYAIHPEERDDWFIVSLRDDVEADLVLPSREHLWTSRDAYLSPVIYDEIVYTGGYSFTQITPELVREFYAALRPGGTLVVTAAGMTVGRAGMNNWLFAKSVSSYYLHDLRFQGNNNISCDGIKSIVKEKMASYGFGDSGISVPILMSRLSTKTASGNLVGTATAVRWNLPISDYNRQDSHHRTENHGFPVYQEDVDWASQECPFPVEKFAIGPHSPYNQYGPVWDEPCVWAQK